MSLSTLKISGPNENTRYTRALCAVVAGGLIAFGLLASPAVNAADVVVVCGAEYRDALSPWCELRRGEGLALSFCSPEATNGAMAEKIRQTATSQTRYLLLVGDAPPFRPQGQSVANTDRQIPTHYLKSRVTSQHGSTPTYPTDVPYTDFDGDGVANAAVGRLPVNAPEQLEELVSRISAYESSSDFSSWRRCLQLTAGVGGFGTLIDGAIESVTRTVLTSVLPADAKPQIAYASPGHAFCPDGDSFFDAVMQRYRSGARFWVYAGHGSVDRLDFLTRARDDAGALSQSGASRNASPQWQVESLLNNETARQLAGNPNRAPIAVLLACYAGAFDAPGDCLSERMLLASGGPIAVIAASRLTMPYGNARFGLGLLESAYSPGGDGLSSERLGDAMLASVQRLQQQTSGDGAAQKNTPPVSTTQMMVDGLAGLMSPAGSDLEEERREHAGLYHLLGDPTLRLQRPQKLAIRIEAGDEEENGELEKQESTKTVCVSVTSPIAGTLTICIDRPLTATASGQEVTASYPDDPHGCTLGQVSLPVGTSEMKNAVISLPDHWSGPVVVRGFVQGVDAWATGATRTLVD
ncbi:C25 family cysteine peptidase [Rhodopirellula sallentina]|nr:C25 family cysteine peptidase [Rhodopirellula sallentina]